MSNRIFKIIPVQFLIFLTIIISGCGKGDRGFVPLPTEPPEEAPKQIIIEAGAVKGPLVNAKINFYRVDLESGRIRHQGDASAAFFKLLAAAGVTVDNGSVSVGEGVEEETALAQIKEGIKSFGYVTELTPLQSDLAEATELNPDGCSNPVSSALRLLDCYLASTETNTKVAEEVETVRNSYATLPDLKNKIKNLQPFLVRLEKLTSFDQAASLVGDFRPHETDPVKSSGWTKLADRIEDLRRTASSTGSIRAQLADILAQFEASGDLDEDLIAQNRLEDLIEDVNNAGSVADAEALIAKTRAVEGNPLLLVELAKLQKAIISFKDVVNEVQEASGLYHLTGIKNLLTTNQSLQKFYEDVTKLLTTELDLAFREALKSSTLADDGLPENLIVTTQSSNRALVNGVNLGDYTGFVYMEAVSDAQTVDLNSGALPLISSMSSIFHTDDINGNGDNQKEDRSLYFLKNGIEQRDKDGALITDQGLIKTELSDELLTVRPYRFATPLTSLGVELALSELGSFEPMLTDLDGDGESEYRVNKTSLKSVLKNASNNVIETFGLGMSNTESLYNAQPIITLPMQYSRDEQIGAAKYRAAIESFSAYILALQKQTKTSTKLLFEAVVKDLSDGETDGLAGSTLIPGLVNVSDVHYLATIAPTEAFIPGTNILVNDISGLMLDQLKVMVPEFKASHIEVKRSDLDLIPAKGGVDSDGDGVLNNSDDFPDDALKHRDIPSRYRGLWMVNVSNDLSNLMPLSGSLDFEINKVEGESSDCGASPCLSIGNLETAITSSWTVISAPENGVMTVDNLTQPGAVGFNARSSVAGDYLVKGTIKTDGTDGTNGTVVAPAQSFSVVVPIHVINPRSIVIRYSPEHPNAGDQVSVQFKVTDELCRLYTFCRGLNRFDNIDDYLDISLLSEFFHVTWQINGSTQKDYRAISSGDNGLPLVKEYNTINGEQLNIEVVFSSGNVSFVASSNSTVVGANQDDDLDGKPNTIDFYPNDRTCWRESDGVTGRTGSVGGVNDCNQSFLASFGGTPVTTSITFAKEEWLYHSDWDYIIRKDTTDVSGNSYRESITLNKEVGLFMPDEKSRRVYIAYADGEIDYFSFEDSKLHDFSDPLEVPKTVSLIKPIAEFLLVQYGNNDPFEYRLYRSNGELAELKANAAFPKPGREITLTIDGKSVAPVAEVLKPSWTISRLVNPSVPRPLPVAGQDQLQTVSVEVSSDKLTLLTGQTQFGDIVTVKLSYLVGTEEHPVIELVMPITDTSAYSFGKGFYSEEENITIAATDYDLSSADARKFIYVKWLKNGVETTVDQFQFFDLSYPYIFDASKTGLGDIITAHIYLEHGAQDRLLDSLEMVVIGDPKEFVPAIQPVFLDPNDQRTIVITLTSPDANDQFFSAEYFVPTWYINDVEVQNESSFVFPSNENTKLKYGDQISYKLTYLINNGRGETDVILVDPKPIVFDLDASTFSLLPEFPDVGNNVSLNFDGYNEDYVVSEGLVAHWSINGTLDPSVTKFVYPGSKLKYGDHLVLRISEKDNDPTDDEDPFYFAHAAEVYIGVNITGDSSEGLDSDGDKTLNHEDYFRNDAACHLKQDGSPDDADGDGLADLDELKAVYVYRTNPNRPDSDDDGLNDGDELKNGTNPLSQDSDGDGFKDSYEVNELRTNPLDPTDPPDAANDNDRDGISNAEELVRRTYVNKVDSDNDGLFDGMELKKTLTDPLSPDSDDDGLSDGLEVKVTRTDPLIPDTDGDGLSDGVEVRLLGFNPLDVDTDDDGVLDNNEPEVSGIGPIPSGVLKIGELKNYRFGDDKPMVPAGTCYATWLGKQPIDNVIVSNTPQTSNLSAQQIAFNSYQWPEVLRYDAKARAFLAPLKRKNTRGNIRALEYDVNDIGKLHLGYPDGYVRTFDTATNKLIKSYYLGKKVPVLNIVDQGDLLLVEAANDTQDGFIHYLFEKDDGPLSPVHQIDSIEGGVVVVEPVNQLDSDLSYADALWDDNDREKLWLLGKEAKNTRLVFESIDSVTPANSQQNAQANAFGYALKAPMFIETNAGGDRSLRFASGHVFDLTANTWRVGLAASFDFGFQHQQHRVTVPSSAAQVRLDYFSNAQEASFWTYVEQLKHDQTLIILPQGKNVLAISQGDLSAPPQARHTPLAFETIPVGDSDSDGLYDWWEQYAGTAEGDNQHTMMPGGTITYGEAFNGFIYAVGQIGIGDADGDGLSDAKELALGTGSNNRDTDGDGLTDGQEVNVTGTNPLNWDTNGNGIADGDEDRDGDGLTDAEELNLTQTNFALADSDGNGINDANEDRDGDGLNTRQEVDTGTSDLLADTDGDGIEDAEEVRLGTSPTDGNEDADGDGLTANQELAYGTNPQNSDTDGDGLSDGDELSDSLKHFTNPLKRDTDGDGLTDGDEVARGTNPLLVDSDRDGLTDYEEVSFGSDPMNSDSNGNGINDYWDRMLAAMSTPPTSPNDDSDGDGLSNLQEVTITLTDPTKADSDNDGIPDGLEDRDGDGLSNQAELQEGYAGSAMDWDSDDDGLSDYQEDLAGTNVGNKDSDGDGLSDYYELFVTHTSPLKVNSDIEDGDTFNDIDDIDEDFDGDGLSNRTESQITLTDRALVDSDSDGIADGAEDFDLDGLTNLQEQNSTRTSLILEDTNGDGTPDRDEDLDGDGLSNWIELNQTLTDPSRRDTDGDGIHDGDEDFDHDGLTNLQELNFADTQLNAADSDGDGILDGAEDRDLDGLSDSQELNITLTDPMDSHSHLHDRDRDGLSNDDELAAGTDPLVADSDGDGFSDGYEVNDPLSDPLDDSKPGDVEEDGDKDGLLDDDEAEAGTDAGKADTDDDGFSDGYEVHYLRSNPLDSSDPNDGNGDRDGDGLTDTEELNLTHTNFASVDTDGDGVNDGDEDFDHDGLTNLQELMTGTLLNVADTDGDGILDGNEDSDGDGLSDSAELNITDTLFNVADSDVPPDGVNDGNEDLDEDGLSNAIELNKSLTDHQLKDTDGDGVEDGYEDFDEDGLSNLQELNRTGTQLNVADSDGDGILDGDEDRDHDGLTDGVELNLLLPDSVEPLTKFNDYDSDDDGVNDGDEDLDGDSLSNLTEAIVTLTRLLIADTDGDGLSDGQEVNSTGTNPLIWDTDGNGVGDGDEDSDGDGLTDRQELNHTNTNHLNPDSDGDGIADGEADSDGDGLSNSEEVAIGTCASAIACVKPWDSDGDGEGDWDEVTNGTSPLDNDTDGDGILDGDELDVDYGTDPSETDGDDDGLSDVVELNRSGAHPFDSDPTLKDTDGDGLSDKFEFDYLFEYPDDQLAEYEFDHVVLLRSNPRSVDTDDDGLTDWEEVGFETNIAEPDTDNDGLSDYLELKVYSTNPLDRDTDDDGLLDGQEVCLVPSTSEKPCTGTGPKDKDSNDNGIDDGDEDSDGDGLIDAWEFNRTKTNFRNVDTDGDGITDDEDDEDGDGLSNYAELTNSNLALRSDPLNWDTDGDGVSDGQEIAEGGSPVESDTDGDGLSDLEERLLGTNPNDPDTDNDGLEDGDEKIARSDPLNPDTDNDFLQDGDDEEAPLNPDKDGDGLLDGIEVYEVQMDGINVPILGSDPDKKDSDGDGLMDGAEVWIFALDADGALVKVGIDDNEDGLGDLLFNSKLIQSPPDEDWPDPVAFEDNGLDRRVYPNFKDARGNIVGTLYVRMISNPAVDDSDDDGLTDFTELMLIEKTFGNHFDPELRDDNEFDPLKTNAENFFKSDPWNTDTDGNGIPDGDEDADGDFYINRLDQDDVSTSVVEDDSDGDGLADGYEVFVTFSDPSVIDTDEDGLADAAELNGSVEDAITRVEVASTDPCEDDQIRLRGVAGKDYCVSVNLLSYPNRVDSDGDGVLDREVLEDGAIVVDHFALDPSCSAATDGFDHSDNTHQCFASWMAEQGAIEQIKYVNWENAGTDEFEFEVAFYSPANSSTPGWDKVVRYDYLSGNYLTMITDVENLAKIEYSPSNGRLYLAYVNGGSLTIKYADLSLDTPTPQGFVIIALADKKFDTLAVAGASLIVQLRDDVSHRYEHKIYSPAGVAGAGMQDTVFNLADYQWDQTNSRLYGFSQVPSGEKTDLGYVSIDNDETDGTPAHRFVGAPHYSGIVEEPETLAGPIELSLNRDSVLLGSGQRFLPDLSGRAVPPTLTKAYKGQTYESFQDLKELAGHFVGVVDYAAVEGPDGDIGSVGDNAIYVEDLSETPFVANRYLLPPGSETEHVLKLLPVPPLDLVVVRRNDKAVKMDVIGLDDLDGDGMTGIYERVYGLDDSDPLDKFKDPDSDYLTNIEEYMFATDPLKADTDGDGWDDIYEIIFGTDPLDATDY